MNGSKSGTEVGLPTVVPDTIEAAASLLAKATTEGTQVRVLGGGTHQGLGYPIQADLQVSTTGLNKIVSWEPEDMTVVVEAGISVQHLEDTLAEQGQTAVLTERPGPGTVGGALAAGVSGWRRFRYGPARDRVLEVTLVTGDGRVVTAGGRLVKNVTGYDIPRLAVGSLGCLGLISQVCLKLWPLPSSQATVVVDSAEEALSRAFRPLAVLETNQQVAVFLSGTPEEVEGQAQELGGERSEGLNWPERSSRAVQFSVRVPPSKLRGVVSRFDGSFEYVAQFGVGEVSAAADEVDAEWILDLRQQAEAVGGGLVLLDAPDFFRRQVDPWGRPPPALTIQKRLIARFDPGRIINPDLLPGGL